MKWLLFFVLSSLSVKPIFGVEVTGVTDFMAERYLGQWYQVASTNPDFQKGCICSKAKYSRIDFGLIRVENSCYTANGPMRTIVGKATVVSPEFPAQFSVIFGLYGTGKVNYTVAEVGSDYEYAVVLGENASYIWILSRESQLAPETIQGIKQRLSENRIDISNLTESDTTQCGG